MHAALSEARVALTNQKLRLAHVMEDALALAEEETRVGDEIRELAVLAGHCCSTMPYSKYRQDDHRTLTMLLEPIRKAMQMKLHEEEAQTLRHLFDCQKYLQLSNIDLPTCTECCGLLQGTCAH